MHDKAKKTGSVCGLLLLISLSACASAPPLAAPEGAESLVRIYRTVGERSLEVHIFFPAGRSDRPRPGILLFHGGGWVTGSPEWTFKAARRFAAHGLVAIAVEYRLSSAEETPVEALADTCAAFRWARDESQSLGLDVDRLAGYGVSAGGHLAAGSATVGCPDVSESSARATPDLLLLWSPALDLGHDGWFERQLRGRVAVAEMSPVEHLRPSTPPTSIVIGEKDTLTPLSGARRFCDRLLALGGICEVDSYPGLGHLLTRNLANQESDFDPSPEAVADGIAKQLAFLAAQGFVGTGPDL